MATVCSKCKGVTEVVGLSVDIAIDGVDHEAHFCNKCWMDLWGVTPYLKEKNKT